jgi:hypothetical protein
MDLLLILLPLLGAGLFAYLALSMPMPLRVRFLFGTISFAIFWGALIVPFLVPWMDSTAALPPPVASLIYYLGTLVILAGLVYVVVGTKPDMVARFTIGIFLLYLVVDWFEPPLVLSASPSEFAPACITYTTGYKASLDYSIGWTWQQVLAMVGQHPDWCGLYWLSNFSFLIVAIIIIVLTLSPQLLRAELLRLH